MITLTKEQIDFCLSEEQAAFIGWDFSHLQGRLIEEPLEWDYKERLKEFLKPDTKLLDMGTGGGEFLLTLNHPFNLTSVTEGYEPNYRLCMDTLARYGINVQWVDTDDQLNFPDNSFDLVINRHESYDIDEVKRVLKKGGHFITQQVGVTDGYNLTEILNPGYIREDVSPLFNLENEAISFKNKGFRIVYRNQCYPTSKFLDIGAVAYYAKLLPWQYPDFTVSGRLEALSTLQEEINAKGFFELKEHRFIIVAKKVND